jgi:hypothetical protein
MPRTNRPPVYRLHKARQCAVVTIHGQDYYLGPYDSAESHEKYSRLIVRWHGAGQLAPIALFKLPSDGPSSCATSCASVAARLPIRTAAPALALANAEDIPITVPPPRR